MLFSKQQNLDAKCKEAQDDLTSKQQRLETLEDKIAKHDISIKQLQQDLTGA